MESKVIKLSLDNYRWLSKLAADLQKEKERPVSLDEALTKVKEQKKMKVDILSAAGAWKMSDKEAEKLMKDIRKGWSAWKIKSA